MNVVTSTVHLVLTVDMFLQNKVSAKFFKAKPVFPQECITKEGTYKLFKPYLKI